MGADTFYMRATGKTADEAFRQAVERAQYDSGHAGYTGTIAEKSDFVLLRVPAGQDPVAWARQRVEEDDPRVSDKWGPAGCVALGDDKWFFFGWASS